MNLGLLGFGAQLSRIAAHVETKDAERQANGVAKHQELQRQRVANGTPTADDLAEIQRRQQLLDTLSDGKRRRLSAFSKDRSKKEQNRIYRALACLARDGRVIVHRDDRRRVYYQLA